MKFKGPVKIGIERLSHYDEFGQPAMSLVFSTLCSVVNLSLTIERTSIRGNQSPSTANSEEYESISTLLVSREADVRLGDRVIINGSQLRVDKRFVRYTSGGIPHHLQLGCSVWQ